MVVGNINLLAISLILAATIFVKEELQIFLQPAFMRTAVKSLIHSVTIISKYIIIGESS